MELPIALSSSVAPDNLGMHSLINISGFDHAIHH
jgi:hypothetical protein